MKIFGVNHLFAQTEQKPVLKGKNQSNKTQGKALLEFADKIVDELTVRKNGKKYTAFSKAKDLDMKFEVIENEKWQELIKLAEQGDYESIDKAYKQAFKELGASFAQALDERGGNGDGTLNYQEFVNTKFVEGFDNDLKNAFKNLDQNGDNKIDGNEMAAFLRLTDNDCREGHSGDDAKIDAYTFYARAMVLNESAAKKNLDIAYKDLFGAN